MSLFDDPVDPDREAGDRPGPTRRRPPPVARKPAERVPGRILAHLSPEERRIMQEELAQYSPRLICAWPACISYAEERHHYLEREVFGEIAERGPVVPLCKKHHRFITGMRAAHDKANRQPRHSSACECEGRGWLEVEDQILGDWLYTPCPGPVHREARQ